MVKFFSKFSLLKFQENKQNFDTNKSFNKESLVAVLKIRAVLLALDKKLSEHKSNRKELNPLFKGLTFDGIFQLNFDRDHK